ncbi:hypothetical protein [Tropicibacter naphthalenivorans]|uniref:Uncharacterized protein n=1 Tax=Tropicibacter naphthalenivorans TaxID=441103 RepID=A0A0P1GD61_9RHOB|nr:hypothetical protein [Tropicibacter naphthalenivorans]CUH79367.1 hypothetical protein TRN7648_02435 [Tropicibacter naphthalenivorans]SMC71696.1 hypothetical protein SAMN04488093_10365 [Tropicibacter naphthalenivorans]
MLVNLALPFLILIALAILVPRGIERYTPESLPGLVLLATLSALALWLLSALLFAGLYLLRGPEVAAMLELAPGAGAAHLAHVGWQAVLIWGPVLALVVMTSPRRWKSAVW